MIGRFALLFLATFLQGCVPQHYTTIHANTVNLYLQAPQATNVQFASSENRYSLA